MMLQLGRELQPREEDTFESVWTQTYAELVELMGPEQDVLFDGTDPRSLDPLAVLQWSRVYRHARAQALTYRPRKVVEQPITIIQTSKPLGSWQKWCPNISIHRVRPHTVGSRLAMYSTEEVRRWAPIVSELIAKVGG